MIRMRTSKSSRRKTDWIFCLAAWVMTALISFQMTPTGVAAAPAAAGKAEVKIESFNFSPAALTVKAGTEITWTNADDIPHTVVSNGPTFKSKVLHVHSQQARHLLVLLFDSSKHDRQSGCRVGDQIW